MLLQKRNKSIMLCLPCGESFIMIYKIKACYEWTFWLAGQGGSRWKQSAKYIFYLPEVVVLCHIHNIFIKCYLYNIDYVNWKLKNKITVKYRHTGCKKKKKPTYDEWRVLISDPAELNQYFAQILQITLWGTERLRWGKHQYWSICHGLVHF